MSLINPHIALRLGLGLMYAYSGVDLLTHPRSWHWAVQALPGPIRSMIYSLIGVDRYLMFQGIGELAVAGVFLGWFLPRKLVAVIALLATFEIGAILAFVGLNAITFRDIGLLGAASALAAITLWPYKKVTL